MADSETSEVAAITCTSQRETMEFCMVLESEMMNNFNKQIYVKTKTRMWRAVET